MKMNKKIILEEETNKDHVYVTSEDICKAFPQKSTLIVAKVNEKTVMEVPEPMYVSKMNKQEEEILLDLNIIRLRN